MVKLVLMGGSSSMSGDMNNKTLTRDECFVTTFKRPTPNKRRVVNQLAVIILALVLVSCYTESLNMQTNV